MKNEAKKTFSNAMQRINVISKVIAIIMIIVLSVFTMIGMYDDYGLYVLFIPLVLTIVIWFPFIKGRIISKFFNWIKNLITK